MIIYSYNGGGMNYSEGGDRHSLEVELLEDIPKGFDALLINCTRGKRLCCTSVCRVSENYRTEQTMTIYPPEDITGRTEVQRAKNYTTFFDHSRMKSSLHRMIRSPDGGGGPLGALPML